MKHGSGLRQKNSDVRKQTGMQPPLVGKAKGPEPWNKVPRSGEGICPHPSGGLGFNAQFSKSKFKFMHFRACKSIVKMKGMREVLVFQSHDHLISEISLLSGYVQRSIDKHAI